MAGAVRFFLLLAAVELFFGVLARFVLRGAAGVFLGLALGRGRAFGGELGLFLCVAAAIFLGLLARFLFCDAGVGERAAAGFLFLVGELAQHHAGAGGIARGRRCARRLGFLRRLGLGGGLGFGLRGLLRGLAALGGRGATRVRFFSTTTALVRPWLKLCLTVEVSVFFSDSVLLRPGRVVSFVWLIRTFSRRGSDPPSFCSLSGARMAASRLAFLSSRSANCPDLRAACTTFSRPRAKLNSCRIEAIQHLGAAPLRGGHTEELAPAVFGPVAASTSMDGGDLPANASEICSKPRISAPARRARPRSEAIR